MEEFTVGPPNFSTMDKPVPNTWSEPPAQNWLVRGPEYLKQPGTNMVDLKQPSAEAPYECIGLNVFKSPVSMVHSASKIEALRTFLESQKEDDADTDEASGGLPKFLIICWMFSNFFATEYTLVQHVFRKKSIALGEDKALTAAAKRFFEADVDGKNNRFKYMFKVVEGPSVMTGAVSTLGGERPVLIGKKLTTSYFKGKNYFEIDMDVGSSMAASMLNSTILQTAGSAVLDESWLFEAQNENELPERVLAHVRWHYCDPSVLFVTLDSKGKRV